MKILIYEETTGGSTEDNIFVELPQTPVGRKSITVKGGLMDISAIDPSCPAWVSFNECLTAQSLDVKS